VAHREPDGDKNHRANNDQHASSTRHATSLAQSRQQSRWRTIGDRMSKDKSEEIVRHIAIDPDPKENLKSIGGADHDDWNDRLGSR
jgi:hypothetical protein